MKRASSKSSGVILMALLIAAGSSWLLVRSEENTRSGQKESGLALRIVSGYSAFTELLSAMGAEDCIVAATTQDAVALEVKSIGSHMRPDIEAIAAAGSDLVLLSSRRGRVVEVVKNKLAGTGAVVLSAHPATVEETLVLITRLGDLTHRIGEADRLVMRARKILKPIKNSVAEIPEEKRPVVFLEVRSFPSLLTCGSDSVAHDIIRKAGGRPLCGLAGSVVHTDVETLVAGNPDLYIQQIGPMNRDPDDPSMHQVIGSLPCVRAGRVIKMEEKLISRPGPRVAEAVLKVYETLYEERQ